MSQKSLIFKVDPSVLQKIIETPILYECPLFLIKQTEQKIIFIRIYDSCILISKTKKFNEPKAIFFATNFFVNLKFGSVKSKSSIYNIIINSFQLIFETNHIEFGPTAEHQMAEIYNILKPKVVLRNFNDSFKLIKKIGVGSFATVYLAQNLIDKKFYAAKMLSKQNVNKQKKGQAALNNEIEILKSIDNCNLMKLDSFYETPDSFYLVLELFRGGNLKSYINSNGPLNEIEASFLFKNVLEGLKYLHDKNIMHRDIKPDNLLFRSNNLYLNHQIALADFGLATVNDLDKPYLFFRCGTPGYVAPEIYEAEDPADHYGVKCDMFSMGVTMYFALTGEMPYNVKKQIPKQNYQICSDLKLLPKFSELSFTAQNLLLRLICKEDSRFDVFQTLNHEFFQNKLKPENFDEDEMENSGTTLSFSSVEQKMEAFKKRSLNLDEKNIMSMNPFSPLLQSQSPISSLLRSPKSPSFRPQTPSKQSLLPKNDNDSSLITIEPILNGFVNTVRTIFHAECETNSDDDEESIKYKKNSFCFTTRKNSE